MNYKSPLFILLVVIIILTIVGSIFLDDYLRMASMLLLGASLVLLIKFTIGKKAVESAPSDQPPADMTNL